MKYETATILLAFLGLATTAPVPEAQNAGTFPPVRMLRGREVPQEHSHDKFLDAVRTQLNKNNPDQIVDPVFGLLGDAAASAGLGKITDPDCLQQATADQAFTNAKAAGDVAGQTAALIYRALERNTGKVGLASVKCTTITAKNPEIAAIQQHQDPASAGAAAINRAIVLELAKQIKAVGGDPQDALQSGTFGPGNLDDNTGKGNTCDTQNDPEGGCIFSENLLVEDATAAEIDAAVAGSATGGAAAQPAASATETAGGNAAATQAPVGGAASGSCPAPVTVTVQAAGATAQPSPAAAQSTQPATGVGSNVQKFTGDLGGLPPPVINIGGARPFQVDGTTDINEAAATQRSCDIQKNACADAANSGQLAGGEGQCETQHTACLTANGQ